LTNVARHAQAKQCTVYFDSTIDQSISENRQVLLVKISDDGIGLPEQFRAGIGLRSMRERAEELGGSLSIEPGIPRGTQITARLPLSV
jgi:signal transduction histidine kinase